MYKMFRFLSVFMLLFSLITACGGGGGGNGGNSGDDNPDPANFVPKFVYVGTSGGIDQGGVSVYDFDRTSGILTQVDTDAASPGIQSYDLSAWVRAIKIHPGGNFLYAGIVNSSGSSIAVFSVDATTGLLTQLDADLVMAGIQNYPAGDGIRAMVFDSRGEYLYASTGGVIVYAVETTTGRLIQVDADDVTPGVQDIITLGNSTYDIGIDPTDSFLYVPNLSFSDLSAYSINSANGALTPIDADPMTGGTQRFATGDGPISVAITPDGALLFASNTNDPSISAFEIDDTTGFLTPIDADSTTVGVQNFTFANLSTGLTTRLTPDGSLLYGSIWSPGGVAGFGVGSTGPDLLSAIDADAGTPGVQNFPAGTNPEDIAFDINGDWMFVPNVNSDTISVYEIDQTSGALNEVDTDPVTPGTQRVFSDTPREITVFHIEE